MIANYVKTFLFLSIFLNVFLSTSASTASEVRGGEIAPLAVKTHDGQELELYGGSYALLIGASRYNKGWSKLPAIPGELDMVEKELEYHGFKVERVDDPKIRTLKDRLDEFVNKYGYNRNNRLLFYFAGHGHTEEDKGYILPVDAPPANGDPRFFRRAYSMSTITGWADDLKARHVLFIFDSCFSGTIFDAPNRSAGITAMDIQSSTNRPVRQYLTSGSAKEEVPAKSIFTPAFVEAIQGKGDLNQDGYVTGSELGEYLVKQRDDLVNAPQTPQYGLSEKPGYNEGDFVFFATGNFNVSPSNAHSCVLVQNEWNCDKNLLLPLGREYLIDATADGYNTFRGKVRLERNGQPFALKSDTGDSEAPIIKHEPPTDAAPGGNLTFIVDVSDNIEVAQVRLYYVTENEAWGSTEMENTSGNNYSTTIVTSETQVNVDYYITASDSNENESNHGSRFDKKSVPLVPPPVESEKPNKGIKYILIGAVAILAALLASSGSDGESGSETFTLNIPPLP